MAVGAECLGAIEHPVVAFTDGGHAGAAGIGTGRGLGEAPGADEFSGREFADVLFFLRFVAGKKNVIGAEGGVGGDDDADRAIHAREFLDGSDIFDVAHAGAAVLRREDHAHQAHLAQLFDGSQGEFSGFVPLHDVRPDFALGELADTLLQLLLLFVQ